MTDDAAPPHRSDAVLLTELDEAELYAQRLRAVIVAIRDELAAGHAERALSMCNQALNDIDSATDVVVPTSRPGEEP